MDHIELIQRVRAVSASSRPKRLGKALPERFLRAASRSRDAAEALASAVFRYGVLVFRCPKGLTDEEQVQISAALGPLYSLPKANGANRIRHREILDQSNLDWDGQIFDSNDVQLSYRRANNVWHSDLSFQEPPAAISVLSLRGEAPAGGNTEFADTLAALQALPKDVSRALRMMSCVHEYHGERACHPLVYVRRAKASLYLASHIVEVVGLPVEVGQDLIFALIGFATQRPFTYIHEWRSGDVIIWDNRTTIHRGRPYDDLRVPRDVRRTTVLDVAASPHCD